LILDSKEVINLVAYSKNKDGYYRASIITGYTTDGKQKRVTVRSKKLVDFKEKLRAAEQMQKQGYDFDSRNITVLEWADRWLETYKKPHVRGHCFETYEINIRLHINPLIGHIKMINVMPYMLQEVLNEQKGKSKSNTEKIKFCLKQMFKRAYLNGITVKDISMDLILPETTEGSRRPLTTAERETLINMAENHRSGLWVLMMLYCGLRPEETVALMWNDISFIEGKETMTISRAVEWIKGRAQIKGVKGKDQKKGKETQRTIPIAPPLVEKLKEATHRGLYVFTPEQSDGMLTNTNLRRMWKSFKRDVDIAMGATVYRNEIIEHALSEEVTPYYLRHTCCTDWFEMGLDLKMVQYLMGHADIKTTANIYIHFTERSVAKAGDIIRGHFEARDRQGTN